MTISLIIIGITIAFNLGYIMGWLDEYYFDVFSTVLARAVAHGNPEILRVLTQSGFDNGFLGNYYLQSVRANPRALEEMPLVLALKAKDGQTFDILASEGAFSANEIYTIPQTQVMPDGTVVESREPQKTVVDYLLKRTRSEYVPTSKKVQAAQLAKAFHLQGGRTLVGLDFESVIDPAYPILFIGVDEVATWFTRLFAWKEQRAFLLENFDEEQRQQKEVFKDSSLSGEEMEWLASLPESLPDGGNGPIFSSEVVAALNGIKTKNRKVESKRFTLQEELKAITGNIDGTQKRLAKLEQKKVDMPDEQISLNEGLQAARRNKRGKVITDTYEAKLAKWNTDAVQVSKDIPVAQRRLEALRCQVKQIEQEMAALERRKLTLDSASKKYQQRFAPLERLFLSSKLPDRENLRMCIAAIITLEEKEQVDTLVDWQLNANTSDEKRLKAETLAKAWMARAFKNNMDIPTALGLLKEDRDESGQPIRVGDLARWQALLEHLFGKEEATPLIAQTSAVDVVEEIFTRTPVGERKASTATLRKRRMTVEDDAAVTAYLGHRREASLDEQLKVGRTPLSEAEENVKKALVHLKRAADESYGESAGPDITQFLPAPILGHSRQLSLSDGLHSSGEVELVVKD